MIKKESYKSAGVDIDKASEFVERIKPIIKTTTRKEVKSHIGGFGALFHLGIEKYKKPLLVSSTDGVGTKLLIARMMNRHDTVGIDLVAMSVNDVVVQGAEPLFFLDYIAVGKLDVDVNVEIVSGIAEGCRQAGCALIGGETAEMPGLYGVGEYDLAGFCVGVVEEENLIDGSTVRTGDVMIGLASSGIHSNGLSLARKVLLGLGKLKIKARVDDLEETIGDELLRPTRIYVKPVLNIIKNFQIKGIVHITGGGFIDNIPRIVPKSRRAVIRKGSWDIPPIFQVIKRMGRIDEMEMFRVFNMGIGMILIASEKEAEEIIRQLGSLGETASVIGWIEKEKDKTDALPISFA
jgi:phosphoribosylformylglycinamidine cyclo-ligase